MPTDPAIQAIQDRIDQEEVKLEKILEEAESLESRINELKASRDRFAAILDGTDNPGGSTPPAATAPIPVEVDETPKRKRTNKAEFRDWVVNESNHVQGFTTRDVMEAFGIVQSAAAKYIKWAREKNPPLIAATNMTRRNPDDKRGRGKAPTVYRYVVKVPDYKTQSVANANSNGALPVAGTGKKKRMKIHPDILDAIRPALAAGADLAITGGDHFRLTWRDKQPIIMSQTPSDRRVTKNIRANLREHGYPVS